MLPDAFTAYVIAPPATPAQVFLGVDPAAVTYLRFPSEAVADVAVAALAISLPRPDDPAQAGIVGIDIPLAKLSALPGIGQVATIGTIYNDDAVLGAPDEDGLPGLASPPTARPGWHVNVMVRP